MWIKYICLENFKNIKTGLKASKLEIDFSNRENTICLITGPNGMGKTSLLSCLTPFATLGNLDIRDNNQLILDKKPGYKRIIIMNGEDEIDIEHFYSVNKDTHSVKSYFKLNKNELNENGNVTSFKSIVNDVLHIDMDYLKLIRLGDNVTNLIRLKGTERKNFMSKMLPNVDNYLKHYKKVSEDVRDLKVVISHIIDKMNKIKIEDKKQHKQKIKEIEDAITLYESEIDKVVECIHNMTFQMTNLHLEEDYKESLKTLKKKENKYRIALSDDEAKIENLGKIKDKISSMKEELQRNEVELNFLLDDFDRVTKEYDSTQKEISETENKIDMELKNANLVSLENYLHTLLKTDRDSTFEGLPFEVLFTEEELSEFVVNLKNIQRELNITYEFGKEPVREAIQMIKENVNVGEFVTASLLELENRKEKANRTYLDTLIDKYGGKKIKCDNSCPYKELYKDVMMVKDLKPVTEVKKNSEYYQILKVVYENIMQIISQIKDNIYFITKLPMEYQNMFCKKTVFKHISNCELIYDEKKINYLMSVMAEYSLYIKRQKEIDETKERIESIRNSSSVMYLNDTLQKLDKKLDDLSENHSTCSENITSKQEMIHKLQKDIDYYETICSALEEYEVIYNEIQTMESKSKEYEKLSLEKQEKEKLRYSLESKKGFLNSEKNKMENDLNEYEKMEKELNRCKEMYDDYVILRSALSTKEGVPLLHIKMYLKDTKQIANDLLSIAYKGDDEIQLDDFNLTGDKFEIPYIKNGVVIPDISYASQGEQSFLNMAISFALSIQNLTEYNIPLLDEVDATFDQVKREKAISVIEKQNEIIQCEQAFVISHNNMYDQYPVDLIDFSHLEDSIFDIKLN